MKVRVMLWKYKILKDGTYPIKIKVTETIDGKTKEKYHPIDAYAKVDQWDDKNRRVTSTHPNAAAINQKIYRMLLDFENQRLADNVINVKRPTSKSVIAYYDQLLETIKVRNSAIYYNGSKSVKNKLEEFAPALSFDRITVRDLKDFESHLLKKENSINTIHYAFKKIRWVFKEAVNDGLLEYAKNPFLQFALKKEETKKTRLPYAKIKEIEALDLEKGSGIWHTRNYWLFSFYCGGIRFGDMCRLKKSNIQKGRLVYTMNKTTKNRSILLIKQAADILKLYKDTKGPLLFNIIKAVPKDKFEELRVISAKNALANKYLKSIENKAVSDIGLSFHSSRHSFADYAKESGLDIHTIKELLGHSKISTTEIYMKSFYKEQTDEAISKMFK